MWEKLQHEKKWTLHDLRRTLATRLNDLGIPPHVVEHLLGHSVSGVAGIYNRSHYINEKKVALDKWLDEIQGEIVVESEKAW
nr:tyrosine-type recombinase/integrase [Shewanella colwelliana]